MTLLQLVVILFTVFMSACAQFLLKYGMTNINTGTNLEGGIRAVLGALFSPTVLGGIFIYGLSVLIWLWVLSKVDLSLAYPFVGVSFIFTLIFGVFMLGESLSVYKVLGTGLICVGCFFIVKAA